MYILTDEDFRWLKSVEFETINIDFEKINWITSNGATLPFTELMKRDFAPDLMASTFYTITRYFGFTGSPMSKVTRPIYMKGNLNNPTESKYKQVGIIADFVPESKHMTVMVHKSYANIHATEGAFLEYHSDDPNIDFTLKWPRG